MAEAGDMGRIESQLGALRASGAADDYPVGFAYLAALARRAANQPPVIRQSLDARIKAIADELASRPAPLPDGIAQATTASPLAGLLAYIGQHAHHPVEAMPAVPDTSAVDRKNRPKSKTASAGRPPAPELKSVAYFRDEWSKLSTEQQLTQTLAQAPENAGPMNSQHLVLRSLQVMRDTAPDYLHGFMSYIDALLWLEHAAPSKSAPASAAASDRQPTKKTGKSRLKPR